MGDVVTLNNVTVCADGNDFAEWLESMAAGIRDQSVSVHAVLLVIETRDGRLGTYCQADGHLDMARAAGLLNIAAHRKIDGTEADPLGIR